MNVLGCLCRVFLCFISLMPFLPHPFPRDWFSKRRSHQRKERETQGRQGWRGESRADPGSLSPPTLALPSLPWGFWSPHCTVQTGIKIPAYSLPGWAKARFKTSLSNKKQATIPGDPGRQREASRSSWGGTPGGDTPQKAQECIVSAY